MTITCERPARGLTGAGWHGAFLAAALLLAAPSSRAGPADSGLTVAPDDHGVVGTYNMAGATDLRNPFFRSLGTNGRSCSTCHVMGEAMSFTPAHAREAYDATRGMDPLFAPVDGANCQSVARTDRSGHSLILQNGLIHISLQLPPSPEFSISVVHDPYGCALQLDPQTGAITVAVYRRPLPATNLSFLSAVMFDGRETIAPLSSESTFAANLFTDLAHQAVDATTGHAQASAPPSAATVQAIVDFELGLYSAQLLDGRAGPLRDRGALGGPQYLPAQPYYPGINDSLGADPSGAAFNPLAMSLYGSWDETLSPWQDEQARARAEIAAGEQLFNTAPLTISNVRGLNDNPALNNPTSFTGHCTTCHDTPNVGNHSLPVPLDIGTSHSADPELESDPLIRAAVAQLSAPDLPVYLISGCPNPFNPGQSESFYTSDPGKALISGHCSDFNRLKGPILRGLAARAPYFHNGAAASLREVVDYYDQRFQMHLTEQQKHQLAAFLDTL